MMRRREFTTLIGGAAAWPFAVGAQQTPMPVIGYLSSQFPDTAMYLLRAFRQGLKDTGYVEGENVTIVYRLAEGKTDRLPELAADLVRGRVTVMAAVGSPAVESATKVTTAIPVVFMVPEDPVRVGLVTSLARPGGNATGINVFAAELSAKRLELLRQLMPAATRVAILLNPSEATIATANLRDVEGAARATGLQIQVVRASIDAAFATFAHERPDALFISSGPFFANRRVQLAHLATRHAVPAIHVVRQYPEVGGLMSYGAGVEDALRHGASMSVASSRVRSPPNCQSSWRASSSWSSISRRRREWNSTFRRCYSRAPTR
jgi:putative tryptophan/tyrosine transport system substrate-binding protein